MVVQRDGTQNANTMFYDFLKLQPLTFQGNHNPSEFQAWMDEIKKAFEVMPYIKEYKVSFVAYLLKCDVEYLWWGARTYFQTQGTPMN